MKKSEMETLWKGLSGGMDGIYERYAQARALRDEEYKDQLQQAKKERMERQNAISAASTLQGINAQKKLASHGLSQSGESLQTEWMNSLTRSSAMNEAEDSYQKGLKELSLSKRKADSEAEQAVTKQMGELAESLYGLGLEEKKLASQQELALQERALNEQKLASQEAQSRAELAFRQDQLQWEKERDQQKAQLDSEKLAEDKRQFDQEHSQTVSDYEKQIENLKQQLSGGEGEAEGFVPDLDPAQLYRRILEENYHYLSDWEQSGEANNETYAREVKKAIQAVLEDESISEDYRKSLELYALIGGFSLF